MEKRFEDLLGRIESKDALVGTEPLTSLVSWPPGPRSAGSWNKGPWWSWGAPPTRGLTEELLCANLVLDCCNALNRKTDKIKRL